MSPFSAPVLLGAGLVSSPALWAALVDQSMSPETAFTRYLICAGLCWAAFAVFDMLVGPAPRPPVETPDPSGVQPTSVMPGSGMPTGSVASETEPAG